MNTKLPNRGRVELSLGELRQALSVAERENYEMVALYKDYHKPFAYVSCALMVVNARLTPDNMDDGGEISPPKSMLKEAQSWGLCKGVKGV